MKLLILLILPLFSIAQTGIDKDNGIAVQLSAGITNVNKVIGKFSIGGQFNDNHISLNLETFTTRLRKYPSIFQLNYGREIIPNWEIFTGISYHLYSLDYGKESYREFNGYKPVFGILHKFYNTAYTIEGEITENIISFKIGIQCVR